MRAFISYDPTDREWAREFTRELESLGIQAWLDIDEVLPGENWPAAVGRALEASDALLVLVSPASAGSATSRWGRQELSWALGSERFENRVVPVIVKPVPTLPWPLSIFHAVTGEPAEAAQQVARRLSSPVSESSPLAGSV